MSVLLNNKIPPIVAMEAQASEYGYSNNIWTYSDEELMF